MSYITSVRKRDGRILPFRKKNLVESIYQAGKIAGKGDRKKAKSLAGKVDEYLKK